MKKKVIILAVILALIIIALSLYYFKDNEKDYILNQNYEDSMHINIGKIRMNLNVSE